MTKRKARLQRPRTPNKFSIHLSTGNLEKIAEIQEEFGHHTRNETINTVIDDYWHYMAYKDLIDAFIKTFRKMNREYGK